MTLIDAARARGRAGPVQNISLSRPHDPAITNAVLESVRAECYPARRMVLCTDRTKIVQYGCLWTDTIGFLTWPEPSAQDNAEMVGSYHDQLGQITPVAIPSHAYYGHFTTLVRKQDALTLQLPILPVDPETVEGGEPDEEDNLPAATMDRLQFGPLADHEADRPVIVALPCYLPLAPGQSFPPNLPVSGEPSLRASFLLLQVWRDGLAYALRMNQGKSVTKDGPLFHKPGLTHNVDPFSTLMITDSLPPAPRILPPVAPEYPQIEAAIHGLARDTWERLGLHIQPQAPDQPPPAANGGGISVDAMRTLLAGLNDSKTKPAGEVEQANAARDTAVFYRLVVARLPNEDPGHADPAGQMVLPPVKDSWASVLIQTKPTLAAQHLQEHMSAIQETMCTSELLRDRSVTFDIMAITTAFMNALRSTFWLLEPLSRSSREAACIRLSFLHFLTPDRGSIVAMGDAASGPTALSHISDDKAQLEASKASSLYSGGHLRSKEDLYSMVCNLRCLFLCACDESALDKSVLFTKLFQYCNLLMSKEGYLFMETYRTNPYIVVHIFQDLQHILSVFLQLGRRPKLRQAAAEGLPIDTVNYRCAAKTADTVIERFASILSSNSLHDFGRQPLCLSWFQRALPPPKTPTRANLTSASYTTPSKPGTPMSVSPPSGPVHKKTKAIDQDEINRRKANGLLKFDPVANGNTRLPTCPLLLRFTPDKAPEHPCMQFLCQQHYCNRGTSCPYPHVTSVAKLPSEADRKAFDKWVTDTPGLSYASGKSPPGTHTPARPPKVPRRS